jgi:hypothetical protein
MNLDPKVLRSRYTGIYAALQWRSLRYTLVCTAVTIGAALVASLWLVPIVVPTALAALPLPVAIGALLGLLFVVVGVLPSLLQIAVTPKQERRAFEAWNAYALMDRQRWAATAGAVPRGFRTPERGLGWIERHPASDPLQRVRLLLWAGRLDEAAGELANWPETGSWPALREQVRAVAEHQRTGAADLSRAREATDALAPDDDYARIGLAIEEARQLHAAGHRWWPPLAEVRERLRALPPGASIGARLLSGLRVSAVAIAIGAVAGVLLSLGR